MKSVYFHEIKPEQKPEEISKIAQSLLKKFVDNEKITLNNTLPLKVHFGEHGNKTFIRPDYYLDIINYLNNKSIKSSFIETNVLYSGKRSNKQDHLRTAENHGFTQLPVVIADGEKGEEVEEIIIDKKHFKNCKIGKAFSQYSQIIVLSHFKGHRFAGFGGAIKQLGMGFASRSGKMFQHANAQPLIIPFLCKKCGACIKYCPEDAITRGFWSFPKIDKNKCIGCAGCIATCKKNAILPNFFRSFSGDFKERIAEYALAAQKNKNNIYINFAMNITKGCDCEGRSMKTIAEDIGIFISDDPVAIDKACIDQLHKKVGKSMFKGGLRQLKHAEEIGLGTTKYQLIEQH